MMIVASCLDTPWLRGESSSCDKGIWSAECLRKVLEPWRVMLCQSPEVEPFLSDNVVGLCQDGIRCEDMGAFSQ